MAAVKARRTLTASRSRFSVPDEAAADRVFNALADGGLVTMPLEETFWAPKFGMLQDRFGVGWMVSVAHKS